MRSKKTTKRAWKILFLMIPFLAVPAIAEVSWTGHADLRAGVFEGQPSWLEGGFGRLAGGGDEVGDEGGLGRARVRLGGEWRPSPRFRLFAHGVARWQEGNVEGDEAGIVEAFGEGRFSFGTGGRFRLRAGQFFLPTSMENVEKLWTSPYTLSLSAVNSWIGEELRPIGIDGDLRWVDGRGDRWTAGGTVFGGNDSLGALLAWRGWSLGDRLSVTGEVLPLPPLLSLQDENLLGEQRDSGTRPFGSDLDGRAGWSGRLRWQRPDRALVQLTWLDNRGDRRLFGDEYAWATTLGIAGFELFPSARWAIAGEWAWGTSGMGETTGPHVDYDYGAAYVLASRAVGPWRLTLRHDRFETEELDGSAAEINDEEGRAWTLAILWNRGGRVRLGTEVLHLTSDRPAAAESGFDADTDGLSWLVELRVSFGDG